jgi:amino acid adenylation domain-containing protein
MLINILEYFEKTVKSIPSRTAIIEGKRKMSFKELERNSKSVAWKLIKTQKNKNKPIAVFLPKGIECVIADIAIIYSGNAYMNLDVKSPLKRLRNILDQIRPVAIITNQDYSDFVKEVDKECQLINISELENSLQIGAEDFNKILNGIIDTDPLCIINTSGSTGTPKGVILNHRSFIDFTEWAIETLGVRDNEIVGSLSPSVFDIYSFELCLLMSKGSTIVILPDSLAAFPIRILNILKEDCVTFIFWVPTFMVNIANLDLLSKIALPKLKSIWFAGEVFPTKQFNYWKSYLPEVKFVNLYGPIEITLDCTYFIVEREVKDDEPIPIGFPCRNTDILILNDKNEIAEMNEDGELCVRGTSLAMGYYNNPEKTVSAFIQNPLNNSYPEIIYRTGDIVYKNERGEIIFKGRRDSLIKHLGYRIELGEIEHIIINTLKLVENGCVLYNYNKKEITLFYESQNSISVPEMRKTIGEFLPKYMVPTSFQNMDQLPRNTNGKIDRLLMSKKLNNL